MLFRSINGWDMGYHNFTASVLACSLPNIILVSVVFQVSQPLRAQIGGGEGINLCVRIVCITLSLPWISFQD